MILTSKQLYIYIYIYDDDDDDDAKKISRLNVVSFNGLVII